MKYFDENYYYSILNDEESLKDFINKAEEDIDNVKYLIPPDFSDKVMKKMRKEKSRKFHNFMIYYVSAASITVMLTASGVLNIFMDRTSITNSNLGNISAKTQSVFMSGWTEDFPWNAGKQVNTLLLRIEDIGRDFNEKEK